jgi:hypothetical protein
VVSITNTLGTKPSEIFGITTATGTQVNRINRNGVISACGTPKAFPGAITGSHTFDSYTFTACKAFCMEVGLNAGAAGVNLFEAAYTPSYDPNSIGTNYAGDAGLSTNLQSFGITTTAGTPYTIVVSDVAGNPLPPPAPPNTYTIQIPMCALNCNNNQLPVAVAHNVTVTSANTGGTANVSVDNGSYDPDGDPITITQIPPGPYPSGVTNVILTVVDPKGATSQANATVTVNNPGFGIAVTSSPASLVLNTGQSGSLQIAYTPTPDVGAPVTFVCSGLPAIASCTFSPASLPAGSPQTSVTMTVNVPIVRALARPRMFLGALGAWMPFGGVGFIGIVVVAPRKRRILTIILMTLMLVSLMSLAVGCGGNTNTSVSPSSHSSSLATVTVTATSGNVIQSSNFSLQVTY